jgi:hypothetical protein
MVKVDQEGKVLRRRRKAAGLLREDCRTTEGRTLWQVPPFCFNVGFCNDGNTAHGFLAYWWLKIWKGAPWKGLRIIKLFFVKVGF